MKFIDLKLQKINRYIYIYIYIYICRYEQSNTIQYTLKMGCSVSSVHTQYSTDAITSK